MQTFDAALFKLYKEGRITLEDALKNADSPNNLRLRISLSESGGAEKDSTGLSLEEIASAEDEQEEEEGVGIMNFSAPGQAGSES